MIATRPATPDDAAAIAAIYAPYVVDSAISFETEPPTAAEIAERISFGDGLYPWIAATGGDGALLGYAYASRFRPRNAYRFAIETSVYVRPDAQRQGIATRLYRLLLTTLEAQGFTQAIAAIALPNSASIKLHESVGFEASGVYRQVGYKLGEWHDVGLWQCSLAPAGESPAEPRAFDPAALVS